MYLGFGMVDTHTCIYCLMVKASVEFGREHVLNDAFGKYTEKAFVLKDKGKRIYRVCKNCNKRFGETIDTALVHETLEGVQRFHLGIKEWKDFDYQRDAKNQKRQIVNGICQGLEVTLQFFPHRNREGLVPVKDDVGFRNADGSYDFYPIKNIPTKDEAELKYPFHSHRIIVFVTGNENNIINELKEKWKTSDIQCFLYDINTGDVDVAVLATYTKDVFRSIAKMAFNYLSYFNSHDSQIALQSCFNPIRNFISEGIGERANFVEVVRDPILYEDTNQAIRGNIITMQIFPNNAVISSISLFNERQYIVKLVDNYNGLPLKTGYGHLFDPIRACDQLSQMRIAAK